MTITTFIGVDVGGSHTRARIVDGAGAVLGVGVAGPANTRIGLANAIQAVETACADAIAEAGVPPGDIAAGLGIAGLNRRGFLQGLRDHPFPFRAIAFASDAAIANLGAHGGADGATVIVGTGSIGFARVGGEAFSVGGYGFPISDEGSGADLGLRAIRRSLWARDGRIPHSAMTLEILDGFQGSAGEIVAWMDAANATDYARFAPLVMDHATAGDPVAEPIVQEAALRIDRLIRTLLERGAPHCCLVGGLAPRIHHWLAAGIRERLREPMGDALDGALLLAKMRT